MQHEHLPDLKLYEVMSIAHGSELKVQGMDSPVCLLYSLFLLKLRYPHKTQVSSHHLQYLSHNTQQKYP
jgi:Ca2+/H+ antiporter